MLTVLSLIFLKLLSCYGGKKAWSNKEYCNNILCEVGLSVFWKLV